MAEKRAKESRGTVFSGHTRRKMIKRLALVAAAGYTAPKAIMISEAWACNKGVPHGPNAPPCT